MKLQANGRVIEGVFRGCVTPHGLPDVDYRFIIRGDTVLYEVEVPLDSFFDKTAVMELVKETNSSTHSQFVPQAEEGWPEP